MLKVESPSYTSSTSSASSAFHAKDGQCHCRQRFSDLSQMGSCPPGLGGSGNTSAISPKVYSFLVFGGKPRRLQKIKHSVVNVEDFKNMKQLKRTEGMAPVTR